jgi:hypothetical protein
MPHAMQGKVFVMLIGLRTENHFSDGGVNRIDVFEEVALASDRVRVVVVKLPDAHQTPKDFADLFGELVQLV